MPGENGLYLEFFERLTVTRDLSHDGARASFWPPQAARLYQASKCPPGSHETAKDPKQVFYNRKAG